MENRPDGLLSAISFQKCFLALPAFCVFVGVGVWVYSQSCVGVHVSAHARALCIITKGSGEWQATFVADRAAIRLVAMLLNMISFLRCSQGGCLCVACAQPFFGVTSSLRGPLCLSSWGWVGFKVAFLGKSSPSNGCCTQTLDRTQGQPRRHFWARFSGPDSPRTADCINGLGQGAFTRGQVHAIWVPSGGLQMCCLRPLSMVSHPRARTTPLSEQRELLFPWLLERWSLAGPFLWVIVKIKFFW